MEKVFKKLLNISGIILSVVSVLTSCSNELQNNTVNIVKKHSQSNVEYGKIHNQLLDICLTECQKINVKDYTITEYSDEKFYALYECYTSIDYSICADYLSNVGDDVSILSDFKHISSPRHFYSLFNEQKVLIEKSHLAKETLSSIDKLFSKYLSNIPVSIPLEKDEIWLELTNNIETYAKDIYYENEKYCKSEYDYELLTAILDVMVYSFRFWSDENKMKSWRDLAWYANCKYIDVEENDKEKLEKL